MPFQTIYSFQRNWNIDRSVNLAEDLSAAMQKMSEIRGSRRLAARAGLRLLRSQPAARLPRTLCSAGAAWTEMHRLHARANSRTRAYVGGGNEMTVSELASTAHRLCAAGWRARSNGRIYGGTRSAELGDGARRERRLDHDRRQREHRRRCHAGGSVGGSSGW